MIGIYLPGTENWLENNEQQGRMWASVDLTGWASVDLTGYSHVVIIQAPYHTHTIVSEVHNCLGTVQSICVMLMLLAYLSCIYLKDSCTYIYIYQCSISAWEGFRKCGTLA